MEPSLHGDLNDLRIVFLSQCSVRSELRGSINEILRMDKLETKKPGNVMYRKVYMDNK